MPAAATARRGGAHPVHRGGNGPVDGRLRQRDGVDVSARMPKWKPTDTFVSIGNEYAGISATGIRKKFAGTGGINAYIAEITEGKRETAA